VVQQEQSANQATHAVPDEEQWRVAALASHVVEQRAQAIEIMPEIRHEPGRSFRLAMTFVIDRVQRKSVPVKESRNMFVATDVLSQAVYKQ